MCDLSAEFSSAYGELCKHAVLKSALSFVIIKNSVIIAPTERFFSDFEYAKRISGLSVRD